MRRILGIVIVLILAGCATRPPVDLSAFRAAAPRSILIVPVVNQSLEVDAANYMLTTMSVPLAEKGYYVFPVNTVKFLLEQEGFYEPERVQQQRPADLAQFFDADAVLFVTINRWDARYVLLATTVTVELSYRMYDRQGNAIWEAQKKMQYSPQAQSAGHPLATLIVAAIQAAVTKAAPNYMPLARQANQLVFVNEGTAVPEGPYASGSDQVQAQAVSRGGGAVGVAAGASGGVKRWDAGVDTEPRVSRAAVLSDGTPTESRQVSPAVSSEPARADTATAQVASSSVSAVTAAPAPRRTGESSFEIQRMGRAKNCSANSQAWLLSQEPGVETYTYQCNAQETWTLRCEFRQCKIVQ